MQLPRQTALILSVEAMLLWAWLKTQDVEENAYMCAEGIILLFWCVNLKIFD